MSSQLPTRKMYRAYFFDAKQRILTADWIKAETDDQAIAHFEAAKFGTKCELWDGERLVAALGEERRQA